MTRLLITGATGMLGGYVLNVASAHSYEIVAPSRTELGLNEPQAIAKYIKDIRPKIVLHLAAQTDVDLCEREPAKAALANVLATKEIAITTAEVGGRLGYVSTGGCSRADSRVSISRTCRSARSIPSAFMSSNRARCRCGNK